MLIEKAKSRFDDTCIAVYVYGKQSLKTGAAVALVAPASAVAQQQDLSDVFDTANTNVQSGGTLITTLATFVGLILFVGGIIKFRRDRQNQDGIGSAISMVMIGAALSTAPMLINILAASTVGDQESSEALDSLLQ